MGQDIDGESAGDNSGRSVSLSSNGNTLAIGAPNNDGTSLWNGDNRGSVRIYDWNGVNWIKRGQDIDGEISGDLSGTAVSLSSDGTILAIGSPNNSGIDITQSGSVSVYKWNGTNWVKRGQNIYGEYEYDNYGFAISLNSDGTTLAIGSHNNDDTLGIVKIYSWNGNEWIQKGQNIHGDEYGDKLGVSVSLNSDGNIIGIGAYLTDDNGAYSGKAKVFQWNGTNWIQKGSDIHGIAGDNSAISVSINSDGSVIVIGAPMNDGNTVNKNDNRGCARIYKYASTPDSPTSVTGTPGDSIAIISFSPPINNGGDTISHYVVTIYDNLNNMINSIEVSTIDNSSSNITISDLSNNTQYKFTVKAKNIAGYGPESVKSAIVTPLSPQNPICYIGKSKVLIKNKDTESIDEIFVENLVPEKYLVYSSTCQEFIPVIMNCISGEVSNFILIEKDSISKGVPSENFYVTESHPILINNCEIKAKNITGAKKIILNKQKIYSIVTNSRDVILINNLNVVTWEYDEFIKSYNKRKNAVWINNSNMTILSK